VELDSWEGRMRSWIVIIVRRRRNLIFIGMTCLSWTGDGGYYSMSFDLFILI
jgi:hypothetical protein